MQEINEYLEQKKSLQSIILEYINDEESNFNKLVQMFDNLEISNNINELKALLHLLVKIIDNHYHPPDFFNKIEQILLYFKDNLQQNFLKYELFNIFKSSKRILLFLIKNNILELDQSIANIMMTPKYYNAKYPHYFFIELKKFIQRRFITKIEKENKILLADDSRNRNATEYFEENRKIGQNDNFLEQLIRNDSIDEFVAYVNKTNMSLRTCVKPSIFETNSFLLKNEVTLIDYSVFFGSYNILKYLQMNNVELTKSLWFYAIHGNNPDIIHFLEEFIPSKDNRFYVKCLNESIKCHHNDIANYIKNNLLTSENSASVDSYLAGIKYYNYECFPEKLDGFVIFTELCKYDYTYIVNFLLDNNLIDINLDKVTKKPIFLLI